MRPGDVVAWRHRGDVQLGVLTSADEDSVWLYRLVPPVWMLRRIVKRKAEVVLVVAAAELHPVLLKQAAAALDRSTAL